MYLSKCSMSPVHNISPSKTSRLKLARLLLVSISVLVSIHIPAAAGRPQCKLGEQVARIQENPKVYFTSLTPVFVALWLLAFWFIPSLPSPCSFVRV